MSSEIVDFTFKWKIENYSAKINQDLVSPNFIANEFVKKSVWNLRLECDTFLGIYLRLQNVEYLTSKLTRIGFTITIVAAETSAYISKKITTKVFSDSFSGFGFDNIVSRDKLLNERHLYLPQDTLTIQCYMIQKDAYIDRFDIAEGDGSTNLQNFNHTKTLYKDLHDLYLDKKLCDIEIRTSDRVFGVHKTVVCARSPAFCAMFEDDTKEKKSGVVDIVDIDSHNVDNMLKFIYSDSVEEDMELDQTAKLYAAADKYCILSLKEKCCTSLQSLLSYANVGEVYVLADLHHDVNLKSAVKNYVFIYAKRVFQSPEWEHFMKVKPELSAEIMHFLWIKHLDD